MSKNPKVRKWWVCPPDQWPKKEAGWWIGIPRSEVEAPKLHRAPCQIDPDDPGRTIPLLEALLMVDPYCAYCRRPLSIVTATKDHIVPRSRGGTSHWENIALACATCNSTKGSMSAAEFRRQLEKQGKIYSDTV